MDDSMDKMRQFEIISINTELKHIALIKKKHYSDDIFDLHQQNLKTALKILKEGGDIFASKELELEHFEKYCETGVPIDFRHPDIAKKYYDARVSLVKQIGKSGLDVYLLYSIYCCNHHEHMLKTLLLLYAIIAAEFDNNNSPDATMKDYLLAKSNELLSSGELPLFERYKIFVEAMIFSRDYYIKENKYNDWKEKMSTAVETRAEFDVTKLCPP